MFDEVNFKMDCPKCGKEVEGFQSKDFYCDLSVIDPVYLTNFYSTCKNCKEWIELDRNPEFDKKEVRENPYTLEEVEKLGFRILGQKKGIF